MKTSIKPIEPPDSFHLLAADGWLGLGNVTEALNELQKVSPELQGHPGVLNFRWQICAQEKRWEACVDMARAIIKAAPELPVGWIHLAYSLRRVPGGGLQAAWDALFPAAEKCRAEVLIPYNLACYATQMKRLDTAREWIRKAFEKAGEEDRLREIRLMALSDPDLEPLWAELADN